MCVCVCVYDVYCMYGFVLTDTVSVFLSLCVCVCVCCLRQKHVYAPPKEITERSLGTRSQCSLDILCLCLVFLCYLVCLR